MDVGYRLCRDLWGQGLAIEAGRAALEFGFGPLRPERIHGFVLPENKASVRVLEKLGLHFETGSWKRACLRIGTWWSGKESERREYRTPLTALSGISALAPSPSTLFRAHRSVSRKAVRLGRGPAPRSC
ncbi:MAG: GNAT family N-acetyltransferase [Flavobacteriales bacterium]|nr:GNAT family N-acetyltransferase [Flavobacteriales bacterium]